MIPADERENYLDLVSDGSRVVYISLIFDDTLDPNEYLRVLLAGKPHSIGCSRIPFSFLCNPYI